MLKIKVQLLSFIKKIQKKADRAWYSPLIGFLAALDNLVLLIPNDGILISSSILFPKKWFSFSLSVAIGSAIGAMSLSLLVSEMGLPWILKFMPDIQSSNSWENANVFFDKYGLYFVFVVSVTPFIQQPAVILASLANVPLLHLVSVIFIGRFIKFLVMAYIGAHAPNLLTKMWGVKGELKEVGIDPQDKN